MEPSQFNLPKIILVFGVTLICNLASAQTKLYDVYLYTTDGYDSSNIPVHELCPGLVTTGKGDTIQASMVNGTFTIGGGSSVKLSPNSKGELFFPPIKSLNAKRNVGHILVKGARNCTFEVRSSSRKAMRLFRSGFQENKRLKIFEGKNWGAFIKNRNLTRQELMEQEKSERSQRAREAKQTLETLRRASKPRGAQKRASIAVGVQKVWLFAGVGTQPQLVQTAGCNRLYEVGHPKNGSGIAGWGLTEPRRKGYSVKKELINSEDSSSLACPQGSYRNNFQIDGVYGTSLGSRVLKVPNHCTATVAEFNGTVQVSSCCHKFTTALGFG
jgi:hypothetical protein